MDYIALQQWVSKCARKQAWSNLILSPAGQGATAAAGDTLPSTIFPADRHTPTLILPYPHFHTELQFSFICYFVQ